MCLFRSEAFYRHAALCDRHRAAGGRCHMQHRGVDGESLSARSYDKASAHILVTSNVTVKAAAGLVLA